MDRCHTGAVDQSQVRQAPRPIERDGRQPSLGNPTGLSTDAGYFSENNVKRCEADEITPYISDSRERHHLPRGERLQSPPPCPEDAREYGIEDWPLVVPV
jgi:hypothetical protein